MQYYYLLIGIDISVFPSYYEPWGYTPMESIAFHIPTITTSLAGFGKWVDTNYGKLDDGIAVIDRNDDNDAEVSEQVVSLILRCTHRSADEKKKSRAKAYEISRSVLWSNFIKSYNEAYSNTLNKVITERADQTGISSFPNRRMC